MPESTLTRLARWRLNWFPAYRASGARIIYIGSDWREVRVRLPLNRRTRNYVGTIFGGSMFSAVDPVYMVMLIKNLGPKFLIWDKDATIRFKRPAREQLFATFRLTPELIQGIVEETHGSDKVERDFDTDLVNGAGEIHATCRQRISVQVRR
jgi:hypothetical protein